MKFEIKNLSCGYDERRIIENFNANLSSGEILCLLGANGVGKTTIFKTILGFLKPFSGEIFIQDKKLFELSDKERAQAISYVPQAHVPPFAFKVIDVVMMSRSAHLGMFENPGKNDEDIAMDALKRLKIERFSHKIYTDLSGGERQMVLIARALAQEARVILLDEPTANLDFGNQIRVLKEICKLANNGYIVIMTSHSPEHVFYCNARVAMISRGEGCIYGSAKEVVTNENLRQIYGVDIRVVENEIDGIKRFSCVPVI